MPSEALAQVLRPFQDLFRPDDYPELLIGLHEPDDAAVYRLDAQRALVLTNDFFTPIVDEPFDYGAIAAANSLSDVYAMGGKPFLALTIAAIPQNLPKEMLAEMMRGLGEKAREAGVIVAGGHTVKDAEPKLGLCVVGLVHPDQLLRKRLVNPGERLVLTKPLGTGLITTAAKADRADPRHLATAVGWMKKLNRTAAEIAVQVGCRSGTDITGFGLLGHACEMVGGEGVGLRVFANAIPRFDSWRCYAEQRLFPGGATANFKAFQNQVHFECEFLEQERLLLFDPQTSGGLLLAIPADKLGEFQSRMQAAEEAFWVIGETVSGAGVSVSVGSSEMGVQDCLIGFRE